MNGSWSKIHLLITTLCAAFASGCTVEVIDTEEQEQVAETEQAITGGGSCNSTDPDWPQCNGGNGPTIPPPECTGKTSCYCLCRLDHPCIQNPAECSPLSACLNQCDRDFPSHCPGGGHTNPQRFSDCF
ncbi:hypothetical protein [Chondromyces apiculatus]|uniref:Secreted protein n=1 Tax=Chondromyces apiculatus DSM 436 TaxID=1192034 RepID=A0A017T989_9BACT|nr:hypothetical protein [Chondromyces apiculatus]EYF05161.1 Hypothetical protein CAP_3526 [Chondromyces apiculatus DSM 436]